LDFEVVGLPGTLDPACQVETHKTVEVIRKKVESEPPENLCPPEGGRQLIGSKFLDPKKMDASHKNGIAYFEPYH